MNITLPLDYKKPDLPMGKAWIDALRSGNYKQGRDYLVSILDSEHKSYCCLGVLCNLQDRLVNNMDNNETTYYLSDSNPLVEVFGASGEFPQGVVVNDENPRLNTLAKLNDAGYSFEDIATAIETIWNPL